MRRAIALAVALAVALTGSACTRKAASDPRPAVIEQVARIFDTLPITGKFSYPALPDQPEPSQVGDFVASIDSTLMWDDYVAMLGGKLPSRSTLFLWHGDEARITTCPDRNYVNDKPSPTVTSTSEPFYCPTDGSGTRYLPMDSIRTTWLNAHKSSSAVAPAMFVQLSAEWADAFTDDVYMIALLRLGTTAFPDVRTALVDKFLTGLTFGYCIVGTFAKSLGLDKVTATNAMRTLFGDDSGMPRVKFREALELGFNTGRPGECIRKLWPGHS